MSNIIRKVFFEAAILKFKLADIGTIAKNGTKANFVPWTIMILKNLGSKNVAILLAKYTTAYTIRLKMFETPCWCDVQLNNACTFSVELL